MTEKKVRIPSFVGVIQTVFLNHLKAKESLRRSMNIEANG